jgi:sec-independent protein translocase protein TatB
MFDLSWTEILVVGVVALIFIGPKELPNTLRTIGKFVSKARSMARDFQGSVQEMVRESELDEIKKQVDKVTTGDYVSSIEKQIDPTGEINAALAPPPVSALSAPDTMAAPGASPPALSPPAAPKPPTG